ncbi:MAG: copper resistance protein NlpE [Bacteroidales bacterium]|nr:copper resistance protein NlpE [Bacteroidales bacterium]MBD5377103.1 copper resistance protein NlpE [Bacteroides sp.]
MKKTYYLAAAVLGLATMASCSGNSSCNGTCNSREKADEVYTGVLPAADADGVTYTLKLDYDDNNTKGDYDLTEQFMASDTTAAGYKIQNTFQSEGDFTVNTKDGKKYIQLTPDVKDSDRGASTDVMYFLVENDSTITLVSSDLEASTMPGLNYSLKLQK